MLIVTIMCVYPADQLSACRIRLLKYGGRRVGDAACSWTRAAIDLASGIAHINLLGESYTTAAGQTAGQIGGAAGTQGERFANN